MIEVNFDTEEGRVENVIEINHFPDNTQILRLDVPIVSAYCEIIWKYAGDEETATLMFLVNHIREHNPNIKIALVMGYIPNARMDRVKNDDEVFTLKYFCKFINSLGFHHVYVLDPHSDVSCGMIDRISKTPVEYDIMDVFVGVCNKHDNKTVIFFPDAGALKRYNEVLNLCGANVFYGEKVRNWRDGQISGLTIKSHLSDGDNSVKGKNVVIVDDIISYGGTMYYSIMELKKLGAEKIYIYCSHLENSVLDKDNGKLLKLLDDGTVECLYSQDTLFSGEHERINII